MLRVHWAIPFDNLSEALACKEADIIPEWVRATLDLTNEGSLDKEAPDTATLTEFFSPYSHTAKGFRTLGGPNELFDAFMAPSPHIMHCGKASFIITAWCGTTLDWGNLMAVALLKEISACQTRKRPAPVLLYLMGLLFRPKNY